MSTGAIIDLVALGLVILFAVIGGVKGFIKTLISVFGTAISLLLAVLLASKVAGFLEVRFGLVGIMSDKFAGILTSIFGNEIMNTTLQQAEENLLSSAGLSAWLIKIVLSVKAEGSVDPDITLNKVISPTLGYYATVILSALALFIIFKLILLIVGGIVTKIRGKNKVLNVTDRTLGFVLGILQGLIIVQIAIWILNILPFGFAQTIIAELPNAPIANFINEINLFGIILKSTFDVGNIIGFIN